MIEILRNKSFLVASNEDMALVARLLCLSLLVGLCISEREREREHDKECVCYDHRDCSIPTLRSLWLRGNRCVPILNGVCVCARERDFVCKESNHLLYLETVFVLVRVCLFEKERERKRM